MQKFEDLTGKKFGRWTVIKRNYDFNGKRNGTFWDCVCDCGTEKVIDSYSLKKGRTKSCGCRRENDLTGQRFGRLVPINKFIRDRYLKDGTRKTLTAYYCKCDCGNIKVVDAYRLLNGETTSCGCYHKEVLSNISKTHGKSDSRLYNIWCMMRSRCNNPNNLSYKDYGGRGISVCNQWSSFPPFYDWAMSHGYSDYLTIERIDVNSDYCPENCTWIPKRDQSNNTRRNAFIEILGIRKTLKHWTNFMGWKYSKYEMRLYRGKDVFHEDEISQIEEKIRSEKNAL